MLPPLYVICDAEACAAAGWCVVEFAAACLDGGATLLQLRDKRASSRQLLEDATAIVQRAEPFGARLIVNDRADVVRMAGADGVHVGQDDLPAADARLIVGPDAMLGLSTHTTRQIVAAAAEPISYLAVGPVFGTASKHTGYDPVGLALVREAATVCAAAGHPVVAIGGITIDRAPEVLAAGAASVAVIGDLFVGGRPDARVRAFLDRLAHV